MADTKIVELLDLCGFEPQEMSTELPRAKRAFGKLGIILEDVERAKWRVNTYYDVELKGIRGILRVWMKELFGCTLAREEGREKILCGSVPTGCGNIYSAAVFASDGVYAIFPDVLFDIVLGCIFDKLDHILEEAERLWLRQGQIHCGMLKTRLGLFALNLIPTCDLMMSMGMICDASPKVDNMLHEFYGMPVHFINTCMDREFKEYPDITRGVEFMAKGLRRAQKKVGNVVGFEITDHMLMEATELEVGYRAAVRKIRDLVHNTDPVPLSATHDALINNLASLPLSKRQREDSTDAINILVEELEGRVRRGLGALKKGAPRVLCTLPSSYSDPREVRLMEELGMAIVATESDLFQPDGRPSSDTSQARDPSERMAYSVLQRSTGNSLNGRISIITGACKRYKIDGLIVRCHVGCRSTAADVYMIKEAVQKELGIPAVIIELDSYDPRSYHESQVQLRRKLEIFSTILRTGVQRG